ncbi:hypothetical protein B0T10DRAFT_405871 [Thelonectria olida]|uniref:C2H2-type domain-containing protein n=1 Tax=Thelonectria olida TaxID=1576542 RepID=A0A9P8W347_9HYPO|nr:hypothetical protein B0T10DRAFT_405871 [Thelonectria olida]
MQEAHSEQQTSAQSFQYRLEGCEEGFSNQSALFDHQRAEHDIEAHECPHQDCSKAFRTKRRLQAHLQKLHKGKEFPCSWPGCGKMLGSKSGLTYHVESAHNNAELKCSYPSCESTFTTHHCLNNHIGRMHPGWATYDHACPAADLENCHHMFSSPNQASEHANITHRGKIPCLYRKEVSCEALFEDTVQARLHARNVHSRYICNVRGC